VTEVISAFRVGLLDFGSCPDLATLLRGRVGARLHTAGNADRSVGLVVVVRIDKPPGQIRLIATLEIAAALALR
jgi:hypothetical protein